MTFINSLARDRQFLIYFRYRQNILFGFKRTDNLSLVALHPFESLLKSTCEQMRFPPPFSIPLSFLLSPSLILSTHPYLGFLFFFLLFASVPRLASVLRPRVGGMK